ncbi:MAG TPA: hypothetical protein VH023_11815, partial [Rhodopila sp.]|nr:hypothetical protein [Rhodopila sp.]
GCWLDLLVPEESRQICRLIGIVRTSDNTPEPRAREATGRPGRAVSARPLARYRATVARFPMRNLAPFKINGVRAVRTLGTVPGRNEATQRQMVE